MDLNSPALHKAVGYFVLFGAELCLFMALVVRFASDKKFENTIRSVMLLSCGVLQLQFLMAYWRPEMEHTHAILFFGDLTFIYLTLTAVHFYRRLFINEDFHFQRVHALHLIPIISLLALEAHVQFLPGPEKAAAIDSIMRGALVERQNLYVYIRTALFALHLIYLSLLFRELSRNWPVNNLNLVVKLTFLTNLVGILNAVMLLNYVVFDNVTMLKVVMVMVNLMIFFLYFLGHRYPELVELVQDEISRGRYERSVITNLDTQKVKKDLETLMEEQAVYCEEDLSVKKLADLLQIGPHQLSELLNKEMGVNFKTYVNTFRVGEAKRLLREEPNATILSIAFAVGFASQSTFYSVFTKVAGTTPSKYRKNPGPD